MSNELISTFSERLKQCLDKKSSFTATQLADAIGLSKQAISMYISGDRSPKRPTIKVIADTLDVNEAWLMGYDVPMERNFNLSQPPLRGVALDKKEIGEILKKIRIESGKTQKEVANIIGRTQQIVGHWETGYSQPDANTLFELCRIYETTVDEAFGFTKKTEEDMLKKELLEVATAYEQADFDTKNNVHFILKLSLLESDLGVKGDLKTS